MGLSPKGEVRCTQQQGPGAAGTCTMWTHRWWCQAPGEPFHLTLGPGARRRHGLWPSPCFLHPPAQGWPLLGPRTWGLGPGVGVMAVSLAQVWAAHSGVGAGPWVGAECSSPPELGAGPQTGPAGTPQQVWAAGAPVRGTSCSGMGEHTAEGAGSSLPPHSLAPHLSSTVWSRAWLSPGGYCDRASRGDRQAHPDFPPPDRSWVPLRPQRWWPHTPGTSHF